MKQLTLFIIVSLLFAAVASLAKDVPKKMLILEMFSGGTSGSPSIPVNTIRYEDGTPMIGADGQYIREYTP